MTLYPILELFFLVITCLFCHYLVFGLPWDLHCHSYRPLRELIGEALQREDKEDEGLCVQNDT